MNTAGPHADSGTRPGRSGHRVRAGNVAIAGAGAGFLRATRRAAPPFRNSRERLPGVSGVYTTHINSQSSRSRFQLVTHHPGVLLILPFSIKRRENTLFAEQSDFEPYETVAPGSAPSARANRGTAAVQRHESSTNATRASTRWKPWSRTSSDAPHPGPVKISETPGPWPAVSAERFQHVP